MSEDAVNADLQRARRIGLDEAVFAESKTPERVSAIVEEAVSAGRRLLVTRLKPDQYAALSFNAQTALDYDAFSGTGILGGGNADDRAARLAIVTAGTSDAAVAREARRTLRFFGEPSLVVPDVGVAGLWRLTERLDELRPMRAVLVVAGMDAALPSVVAGLVPGLVVAVPTSVGYGVAAGGHTALNAALASCAPGLVVVNIDNGYGAACAALRALGTREAAGQAEGPS